MNPNVEKEILQNQIKAHAQDVSEARRILLEAELALENAQELLTRVECRDTEDYTFSQMARGYAYQKREQ